MEIQLFLLQLQIMIAIIVVLLLRGTVMRKLPKVYSYLLWILVFARLLCPVTLETDFSLMPSRDKSTEWIQQTLYEKGSTISESVISGSMISGNAVSEAAAGQQDMRSEPEAGYEGDENGRAEAVQGTEVVQTGALLPPESVERSQNIRFIMLSVVWALGAAGVLGYNIFALMRVRRYIQKAEFFMENVYLCEGIASPFTLGLLRPRIYLPKGLCEEERNYIICHERVHIRRKDYLVKNAAFLLTALYWFNPFVWIAFCFLERDMEMSCDEKVILLMGEGIKRRYSQSLLNFAKGKTGGAMTPLTFGENSVKQRIKNILSYKNAKKWSAIVGIVILAAAGVILFTTQRKGEQEMPEEESQIIETEPVATQQAEEEESGRKETLADYEHDTMEKTLERWVRAFIERDAYTLYALASDKEQFMEWDYVDETGNGGISFGYSSPWPWEGKYRIAFTAEDEAVIRYYMNTSIPDIYIGDETVKLVQEGDLYYVNHEKMTEYFSIESKEQFEQLYGREGSYDFSYENTGYTIDFYRQILRNRMADDYDYHEEYTAPVTAAIVLLHLGEGEGGVTFTENVPISGTQYTLDSRAGEGSKAYVTYTFAKDNSVIEFPMEMIEDSQGIWAPAGSGMVGQLDDNRE